ncbi:DUF6489 family protein [Plasticicumulans acidivorans]|uniref:Uncharacterized protein n=1 Tax=Plasticicumulans acidivorans TaxID=886464 RepID=A0A317MYU3_9GAMM|nr:DUF6489 family protein [Plasticicumulans acidivorans]PWV64813.1 hypothetical protein C7443_102466 [Plasticicumulans acidivorans]
MKLNVNVEATPQELREFLGLPNVQPLHDEMMALIRENMMKGANGFDPVSLMKPFLANSMQVQSVEALQKLFWDAFNHASGAATGTASAAKKDSRGA